jgi:hypothetical protein
MNTISFELPFHGTCANNQIILHSENSPMDFLNLDQAGLDEMPDVIIFNSKRYKYSGVSDGRGQYYEENI